jgi:BirA family biotin operon repressor/biotin-[acetyl-CoA-carboxylase] ligase
VVALSAVAVATELCDVAIDLKWPNDLLVNGTKVAGILAQAAPVDAQGVVPFVVVGLGLNLGWAPDGATSLSASKWSKEVTPHEFLTAMLPRIDLLLSLTDEELHAAYVSKVATIGTRVKAHMPDGNDVVGRAIDVERDGRLVLIDDCAVSHRIDTADVVHLRPATE